MPEFDLDDFKQTWQKQETKPRYEQEEILTMLNKKSRNYVKYILWISVLEFLLFLSINIYNVLKKSEQNSFISILEKLGVEKTENFMKNFHVFDMTMNILTLVITAYFVILFYINYKKIHVESNLRKFILQIFKFKKTVNLFILVNVLLIIFSAVLLTLFSIYYLQKQEIQLSQPELIVFVTEISVIILLSLAMIWLYYKVVYGIILKRLSRNLSQLQEIEDQHHENE